MRPTKERLEEIRESATIMLGLKGTQYLPENWLDIEDLFTEIDALNSENHILHESLSDMRTALARAINEFHQVGDDHNAERFEQDLQENKSDDVETHRTSYEQIQGLKDRIAKLRNGLFTSCHCEGWHDNDCDKFKILSDDDQLEKEMTGDDPSGEG